MAKRVRKPASPRQGLIADLTNAACWCRTAAADVRRRDRIDAIDAVQFAQKALHRAEQRLVDSVIASGGKRS